MGDHPGGVIFYTDVYMDAIFKDPGGFSIGSQITIDIWHQQFTILANLLCDNEWINHIRVGRLQQHIEQSPHTRTYQQRPDTYLQRTDQPAAKVSHDRIMHRNCLTYCTISCWCICWCMDSTSDVGIFFRVVLLYIHFTTPATDSRGRMLYKHTSSDFNWVVGGSGTTKTTFEFYSRICWWNIASSSDKRSKFNEKPLTSTLDVINQLDC